MVEETALYALLFHPHFYERVQSYKFFAKLCMFSFATFIGLWGS